MAVAVNQVFNGSKWNWRALGIAVGVAVGAELVNHWLDRQDAMEGDDPRPAGGKVSRRRYLRRVRLSVEQMETMGLVTQADLVLRTRQVYVDVMLRPRTVADATTDSGIGPGPSSPTPGRRAQLSSFLTAGCVLAVLGAAGSGKTTLARYTALEMAEQRRWPWHREFWRPRIPVLLYLREHAAAILASEPEDLAQVAVDARGLRSVVPAGWLRQHLESGRCVVLLDGLDEVADADDRWRVISWVDDQISRFPGNSFVVTSRPLGYEPNQLSRADVLQVQRFTYQQIRDFLSAWYRAIDRRAYEGDQQEIDRGAAESAEKLFNLISTSPALYDLAANPLLLTMIASVHRYRGQLPGSRVALYEEMCQVLLHRRQSAKGLKDSTDLSGDQKERILQELAWHMMRHTLRDIPAEDAHRAIRRILQRTGPELSADSFLDHARRSGMLVERQHRHYGFVHLTLQEFLASALVPQHPSHRQRLIDKVRDSWWRETTLLWAARNDASPVVEACLAARTVTSLSLAYACADEALELEPDLRAQLDEMLTVTPTDPNEIKLFNGIAAARELHDTRTLNDNGVQLCVNTVSQDLWNRSTGQLNTSDPLTLNRAPATHWWPRDIDPFLTWLNSHFSDGTSYRLPTTEEAHQAAANSLLPVTAIWAGKNNKPHLFSPPLLNHPLLPPSRKVAAYSDLILDHTHLFFRLLFSRSSLSFIQLLTYARPRDLTRPDHQLLTALDLALALKHAEYGLSARTITLARALNLDVGGDSGRVLARNASAIARSLGPEIGLELGSDNAHNLGRALNLDRDHERALNLALYLDLDLNRATDRAPGLERDLRRAVLRDPDHDHDHSSGTAIPLDMDLRVAREFARAGLATFETRVVLHVAHACNRLAAVLSAFAASDQRPRSRAESGGVFHQPLSRALATVREHEPVNDPEATFQQILSLMNTYGPQESVLLIENAQALAAPLWDRGRQIQQRDLVLAATLLLAVFVDAPSTRRLPELNQHLSGLLCALIALTPRGDHASAADSDRLLVLVKN
ncbi:NACHT domain-containing protein [Actinomadura soli]|uniref:NACHT domain-containing protein n=1 Tax=Actinomadura soli TaxID=2508997 RepID=UPI001486519C|nr:NACHT domain-containing protein [Actinomadura soli]